MRRLSSFLFGSMPRHLRQLSRKEITSPPPRWSHSHSRRFLFSKTIAVEKSYQQSNLLKFPLGGNSISLFNQDYVHFSSLSTREETENHYHELQVEIISKELIKPDIPTPAHLRMHELSLVSQLFPNIYSSLINFYPNDHQNDDQFTLKRRRMLKESLSKTLTKFYPLAGRFVGNRHIDCNDDGIHYVEAKVNRRLTDFLKQPENKSLYGLLPFHPQYVQSLSEKHVVMVQVTEFSCGGLAVGTYISHKLMDGLSITAFFKAWSNTARGSSEEISPSFVLSSVLPSNPNLPQDATILVFPLFAQSKSRTRRFVFPSSSLATLKRELNSSRVLAVTGLIWKRAVEAFKSRSKALNRAPQSSSLAISVNIRDKVSPPLSPYSIGDIHVATSPLQYNADEDLEVDTIVQRLKDAKSQFTSEYLEQMVGYWLSDPEAALNMIHTPYSDKNAKHVLITSMCRSGIYEADFGWGKPIWISVGNGDSDFPMTDNLVFLMDTRCGKGIEAWVTLSEEDMEVLEKDQELLASASLDPSPLESVE